MPAMTPAELDAFLARPLVASLSTTGAGGAPRVTPVWFQYADGRFYVWTDLDSAKYRHVVRDPRVALCIATHDEPYRYVVARGRAEIQRDGVVLRAVAIAQRYYGPERGEQYGRLATDGQSVILAITPDTLISEASA
jgi:PPOX class probable F420-dependent enzyme